MARTETSTELPGRYREARHLASGGMASVWAARDSVLGRPVAVKLLAEHFVGDRAAMRRFQREARAAAKLSQHPHVVTIYDVGEHGGRPFIVMELMDGGSLAAVLRGGRPPRADALRWVREAAAGLDAAHERGIVHRDVKPGNLLLDSAGRLGVADFGIARLAWETSLTVTGHVLGTAAYVAPEQAAGERATDASDRYSLAVVAYELLTGERPYPGGSFAAQARAHIEAQVPPASGRNPDLRPAVDGVLARGMGKDPAARWPSATAFAEALARAAGEEATDATEALTRPTAPLATRRRPPGAAAAPAAARAGGAAAGEGAAGRDRPRAGSPPPAPRAPARRRLLALFGVLAALLLVVVVAVALGGGDGGGEDGGAARQPPAAAGRAASGRAPAGPGGPSAPRAPSVAQLNDRGFELMSRGRNAEAIPLLRQAVERCGDSREIVCAYALYNLGRSLRLTGRPGEAIPVLERRLAYDDQTDVVAAELEAARRAAGATPAPGGEAGAKGKGKDKGKGKKKKDD